MICAPFLRIITIKQIINKQTGIFQHCVVGSLVCYIKYLLQQIFICVYDKQIKCKHLFFAISLLIGHCSKENTILIKVLTTIIFTFKNKHQWYVRYNIAEDFLFTYPFFFSVFVYILPFLIGEEKKGNKLKKCERF